MNQNVMARRSFELNDIALGLGETAHKAGGIYDRTGVVLLQHFFPAPQVNRMAREADRLYAAVCEGSVDRDRLAFRRTQNGQKIFERIDPVCDLSKIFLRVSANRRLIEFVRAVLGSQPALLKDKLIYKFPGDSGYAAHQDHPYLSISDGLVDAVTTVGIAIDPIHAGNGALCFYAGYHGSLLPASSGRQRDFDPKALFESRKLELSAEPGDVFLFHSLTPHESCENRTSGTRRILFLTYASSRFDSLRQKYYATRSLDPDILR